MMSSKRRTEQPRSVPRRREAGCDGRERARALAEELSRLRRESIEALSLRASRGLEAVLAVALCLIEKTSNPFSELRGGGPTAAGGLRNHLNHSGRFGIST